MKNLPVLKYGITLVLHLLFWIGVYFSFTYFLGYGSTNIEYVNKFSAYLMPITMAISYLFFSYLIPKFLLKGKQKLFVLYSLYTFIVSFFLVNLTILYASVFLSDLKSDSLPALTKTLPFIVLGVYFAVIIAIAIGLVLHNLKSIVKNEDLKSKFLQTQLQLKEQELKFLKMQIHPHFLFNSLNTIYGYALKKENEAPEMILKLSNLLDYILYQVEKPQVSLQDEINHLKDYVALEKMRFHDTLQVDFVDNSNNSEIQIAPMLLIPFVENSFKHGGIINGKLTVKILISFSSDELQFSVENSIKTIENSPNGIGLENIKKRLQMLYPDAHSLQIEQKNTTFKVILKVATHQLKQLKNVE